MLEAYIEHLESPMFFAFDFILCFHFTSQVPMHYPSEMRKVAQHTSDITASNHVWKAEQQCTTYQNITSFLRCKTQSTFIKVSIYRNEEKHDGQRLSISDRARRDKKGQKKGEGEGKEEGTTGSSPKTENRDGGGGMG